MTNRYPYGTIPTVLYKLTHPTEGGDSMKSSDVSPKFDPIMKSLQNEIQIRANQLLIDQSFDVAFYETENMDDIVAYYEGLQSRGQINMLRILSENEGTMVVIHNSETEEMGSIDIVLRIGQDLVSLSFQALKALIWYKYFLPIEVSIDKQINCIIEGEQSYDLFVTNVCDTIDKEIEALAIHFTGVIQELAILNSPNASKEEDRNG